MFVCLSASVSVIALVLSVIIIDNGVFGVAPADLDE